MMANTFISKEQFCRDYHVGKATALWLIQTGLLPAIDTGRKTGRYLIADTDIQTYLHQRELDPKKYRYQEPPEGEGYQLWENTTEGSPLSPVFPSLDVLCAWAADNATLFGDFKVSKDVWNRILSKKEQKKND